MTLQEHLPAVLRVMSHYWRVQVPPGTPAGYLLVPVEDSLGDLGQIETRS